MTRPMPVDRLRRLMRERIEPQWFIASFNAEFAALEKLRRHVDDGDWSQVIKPLDVHRRDTARSPEPRPGVPEPEGLPPVGWWIGATYEDGEPIGRVHQFIGWSPGNGNLGVRCNRHRPGRRIENAFSNESRGRRGLRLRLSAWPPEDACQKCLERQLAEA